MASVGKNMLAVHPEVARRVMRKIDEQCSLYYIIIGSVYNLSQSAMVDGVNELRQHKRLWRHEVKRDARRALAAYRSWNEKMKLRLADRYQLWLDMSDGVEDRLREDVRKLRWSYDAVLMKHNVEEHGLCAALLTALTMNDIADMTFRKFLRDGSKVTGVDMTEIFGREASFRAVKTNWENAVRPILRCQGGDINCNGDANCVLAADIISRKLSRFDVYEEACGYGAELNMKVVEQYAEKEK